MKLNTTDFRRKLQHPLVLALVSVPVAMIIILNLFPEAFSRMWLLPGAYVLLSWGCILLPGRKRLLGGMISAALVISLAWFSLPMKAQFLLAMLPAMYVGLLYAALPIGGWERHQELNVAWHVIGVCTHMLLQLLVSASQKLGTGVYNAAQIPLLVNFLCFAVLVLLALNRTSLDSAAQSRRTVPLLMRRQNIAVTMALMAIGVLIAAIPAIGSALGAAWDAFLRGVAYVAGLLMALLPQGSSGAGGAGSGGDMGLSMGEAAPPSQLALIMEKIIGVVALAAIAAAVVLLLRVGGRKLWKLLKYLWGRLGQYGAAVSEDYEDEITDTRDEADVERNGLFTRLRSAAPVDEKGRTPAERVRSRYRRLKQRHGWSRASTARETLPPEAAGLYERARYSGQELSEEDAERFRERTKKI